MGIEGRKAWKRRLFKRLEVRTAHRYLVALLLLLPLSGPWAGGGLAEAQGQAGAPTRIFISGLILDSHLSPVRDAVIRLSIEGQPQALIRVGKEYPEVRSASDGSYTLEVAPRVLLGEKSKLEMEVSKPTFMTMRIPLDLGDFAPKGELMHLRKDISLPRKGGPALWIAVAVFASVYLLIAFELVHRLLAVMLGSATLILVTHTAGRLDPDYSIVTFHAAMEHVDMNAVLFLLAAMVIVGVLRHTGVFQWAVHRCFALSRGRGLTLLVLLIFLSAGTSALVENAATMVLLAPVTLVLAQGLRMNPLALLVPQVMAANLGGAATLVGDIPNLMIGSRAGLAFPDFLGNLGPVCGLALVALLVMSSLWYRRDHAAPVGEPAQLDAVGEHGIEDKALLFVGLGVVALVLFFLATQGYWKMQPSVPTLAGASVLFAYWVLSRKVRMLEFLEKDMEWPTILFLIFLFVMVGALEEVGALSALVEAIRPLCLASPAAAICLVLWAGALTAAFVDILPFTAAMLPVVAHLQASLPEAHTQVLWWALALGVSLGGNGTLIGGSANMVAMGIASSAGYPISFARFMKFGFLYMLISVGICNVWLLVFYG